MRGGGLLARLPSVLPAGCSDGDRRIRAVLASAVAYLACFVDVENLLKTC